MLWWRRCDIICMVCIFYISHKKKIFFFQNSNLSRNVSIFYLLLMSQFGLFVSLWMQWKQHINFLCTSIYCFESFLLQCFNSLVEFSSCSCFIQFNFHDIFILDINWTAYNSSKKCFETKLFSSTPHIIHFWPWMETA